jgi:hypothetical protein
LLIDKLETDFFLKTRNGFDYSQIFTIFICLSRKNYHLSAFPKKIFLTKALAEDTDAGSEAFGGRWGRGIPQQAGCVALARQSIFKPSGHTWRLGKCDQTNNYFQAKWAHLAARKKRSGLRLVRFA